VSKGFESMFIAQMTKAMRRTIHSSAVTQPSKGREVFTEFLDAEYAKTASGRGADSIAGKLFQALRKQAQNPPQMPAVIPGANHFPVSQYQTLGHINFNPPGRKQIDKIAESAAERYGLDALLLKSVIQQESAYKPFAVSHAGAKGLMQLMDGTAKDMGVGNSFDAYDNIMGGARYLSLLLERFGQNEKLALAAYNAGPTQVEKYRAIPPFPETRKYVDSVLAIRNKLSQNLKGGGGHADKVH
jgi:soluble lytic murein transglycosylase-like protein